MSAESFDDVELMKIAISLHRLKQYDDAREKGLLIELPPYFDKGESMSSLIKKEEVEDVLIEYIKQREEHKNFDIISKIVNEIFEKVDEMTTVAESKPLFEIRKCPFCGGKAGILVQSNVSTHTSFGFDFEIGCEVCNVSLPQLYESRFVVNGNGCLECVKDERVQAIQKWNGK